MNSSLEINAVIKAYIPAQQSLGNVSKDKVGPNFKYADLPQVLEAIKNALLPHGLVFFQLVGSIVDNKVSITNILAHESGQYIEETAEIYIDAVLKNKYGKAIMSRTQRCGVAITYLRRKSALAFFAIGEEDYVDKGHATHYDQSEPQYSAPAKPVAHSLPDVEEYLIQLSDIIMKTPNPAETIEAILTKHQVQALEDISIADIQKWIAAIEKKLSK